MKHKISNVGDLFIWANIWITMEKRNKEKQNFICKCRRDGPTVSLTCPWPQYLWWVLAVYHPHSSNWGVVNDSLAEHLHLYLILMTNSSALFPPMFTNEEPEPNKAEPSENWPRATQTQVRLKAGTQRQVNQESTCIWCETRHLTPTIPFHCCIPRLSGNNAGMFMLTRIAVTYPAGHFHATPEFQIVTLKAKPPEESRKGQNEDGKQHAYVHNPQKTPWSAFSRLPPHNDLSNNTPGNLVSKPMTSISAPPLYPLCFSLTLLPC